LEYERAEAGKREDDKETWMAGNVSIPLFAIIHKLFWYDVHSP
jgi:hypothetical protein